MSKQTEALKLALEALEAKGDAWIVLERKAKAAIREALAEQETVLPGGGHVPAVPVAVYGYCPECGGAGVMRERRPNGDDKCTNGHKYPSSKALAEQPAQQEQGDSNCQDADGCPTEMAVLQRFWRGEPIPAEHYPVWFKPAQQQEPVAWVLEWTFNGEERGRRLYDDETHCVFDAENDGGVCRPLVYGDTSPPASKPWVGLTQCERTECFNSAEWNDLTQYAEVIEAKLREKNT